MQTEMGTPRADAPGGGSQELLQDPLFPLIFSPVNLNRDLFRGQGTLDKHHFAVWSAGDTLTF